MKAELELLHFDSFVCILDRYIDIGIDIDTDVDVDIDDIDRDIHI